MPTEEEVDDMIASYTKEGEAELMRDLLQGEDDDDMDTNC